MFLEEFLAHADREGRDLDQLVVIDEFERLFQREADWRRQNDVFVRAGCADIGELLGFERIHDQVIAARVDADDHAFVDLFTVADHELAALLQVEQRIAQRFALAVGDHHAVVALADADVQVGTIMVEHAVQQARARRERQKIGAEPDQASRRDDIVEPDPALAVRHHVLEFRLALAQRLHNGALALLLDIHGEQFVRLLFLPVHFVNDDLRPANREFIAFAAHVFDQH